MKTVILMFSLLFNLVLATLLFYVLLQGCAEMPNGRIGVLKKDIKVGYFGSNKTFFTLPKGLVVREASATGADWFEPYRFRLVITSDSQTLVDYSVKESQLNNQKGEYYSADVVKATQPK